MAFASGLSQRWKVYGLLLLFTLLVIAFLMLLLGNGIYFILLGCAVAWLAVEVRFDSQGKNLKHALFIGVFLMAFDFVAENAGGVLGLWRTYDSVFPVFFVPLEIMLVCVFGGMAWALYQPKRFSLFLSAFDVLFFSFFGAVGESLIIRQGLMRYAGGWTPMHAFFGYAVTWIILQSVRYRFLEV